MDQSYVSRLRVLLKSKIKNAVNFARLLRYDALAVMRFRANSNEKDDGASYFFPVCFTCGRHFDLLRIALKSLDVWAPAIKEIYIFIDKADPFTDEKCDLLRSEVRYPIHFQQTVYAWKGPLVFLNMLCGFRQMAERMRSADFILKFDSDVIFLSDAIFHSVTNGEAAAIGAAVCEVHPSIKEDYMQGGCFFIAGAAIRAITSARIMPTARTVPWGLPQNYDDQFISELLRNNGIRIVHKNFMHYDSMLAKPELDEAELATRLRAIPSTMSVIHFEGDKANMRRAAKWLLPA
jgi:hypothetical protein